jgi:hypothetical protein
MRSSAPRVPQDPLSCTPRVRIHRPATGQASRARHGIGISGGTRSLRESRRPGYRIPLLERGESHGPSRSRLPEGMPPRLVAGLPAAQRSRGGHGMAETGVPPGADLVLKDRGIRKHLRGWDPDGLFPTPPTPSQPPLKPGGSS